MQVPDNYSLNSSPTAYQQINLNLPAIIDNSH